MDLLVETPRGRDAEREYILSVVLTDFLGVSWRREFRDGTTVRIAVSGASGELILPDILFSYPDFLWLKAESLPETPLPIWDTNEIPVPLEVTSRYLSVIYGDRRPRACCSSNTIYLPIDVFGSAFFMLARYEELVKPDRDEYNRFPAHASLAYQEGFLERPIVDEYVEILWACMQRLWPWLKRKERSYQVHLSHDVDHPLSAANKPWVQVLRGIAGDLVKRKDLKLAYRRFMAKYSKDPDIDPFNTFGFIMDMSEQHGLKSAFYFKAASTNDQFDEDYALDSPWIQGLLQRIHERGHEIGLHASYEAYRDPLQIQSEFGTFLSVVEKLGIRQKRWGGRQHYLRFEAPTTWQAWENVGLDYDATVGFADHVGFRCGTCHEYPVFNLKTRRILRLRERPLIVMDTTLLNYMSLRPKQVLEKIERLSNICRKYGGIFSLLWHNTSLIQSWERQLYLEILRVII